MPPTGSTASRSKASNTREARAKRKARAERAHERYVQRVYGLEPGMYQRMLDMQGGRCAICGRIPRNRRLAVDHDHNTGEVRALICYLCNKYLGQWEFDPIAAHNAAVYLGEIARAYGPEYDPFPRLPAALVKPMQPGVRLLPLKLRFPPNG